jgi:hypothetical protein
MEDNIARFFGASMLRAMKEKSIHLEFEPCEKSGKSEISYPNCPQNICKCC